MGDILIKGMEMPRDCMECDISQYVTQHDRYCLVVDDNVNKYSETRHPKCPLVEVKPHGDLIDRDELVGAISDAYCENCCEIKPIGCKSCEMERVMEIIGNAPVVIPMVGSVHKENTDGQD